MKHRLPALDWMRGIVMVLMAVDHASGAYNAGRVVTDSPFFYKPEVELPALQFFNRWITHLCAPSFLFLAGTALALSIERKVSRGVNARRIDVDLLIRGLIIISVDVFFINLFWAPGYLLLAVMYAIGCSMILMILGRRLPTPWLIAAALAVLAGSELFLPATFVATDGWLSDADRFLVGAGIVGKVLVVYPVLPWWAMMALGWGLGRHLLGARDRTESRRSPARLMFVTGAASLGVFAGLRGLNSFGNMELLRVDDSWGQWLHVSKYPPSLTFAALELGLMAVILAGLFWLQDSRRNEADD